MESNKLLKLLKEGDIVLTSPPIVQILKITNLKFEPANEECSFDWLDFDRQILYTNVRLHKSESNFKLVGCMGISEIVPIEIIELIAKREGIWKFEDHQLSDEEFEASR